MARLLEEQKKRLQGQQGQLRDNRTQVQRPGAAQTMSAGQQPVQTQSTQTRQPSGQTAELHSGSGGSQTTAAPAQSQGGDVVAQAQQYLNQQLDSYNSRHGNQISELVSQLRSRPGFEYDVNTDPTYQMLREVWSRDGMMAMEDTMGEAAQLTGGYGNSYAQTAGQQTYQGYMRGLNEMVPDLKEAARADYDAETQNLLQQYGLLMEQEEQDYARYLDAVEQQRYADERDYERGRDAVADARYEDEWAYQRERDAVEDARYAAEWAYAMEQDERDYALELALAAYEMGDDSLIRAMGIDPQEYGVSYSSSGSGNGSNDLQVDAGSLAELEQYYGDIDEETIERLIQAGVVKEEVVGNTIYYRIVTQEKPKQENPTWEHGGHTFTGW